MRLIVNNIDILNNWVGKLTCLMLVPVIFAMIYEVVARKVFIAPTDWAYDTSRMFSGAMFMLGAGYALMRGVHIRADFLFRNWSPRTHWLMARSTCLFISSDAVLLLGLDGIHHQGMGDVGTIHGYGADGAHRAGPHGDAWSEAARCFRAWLYVRGQLGPDRSSGASPASGTG